MLSRAIMKDAKKAAKEERKGKWQEKKGIGK